MTMKYLKNSAMYVHKYHKDHIEEKLYVVYMYKDPNFQNKEASRAEKFVDL